MGIGLGAFDPPVESWDELWDDTEALDEGMLQYPMNNERRIGCLETRLYSMLKLSAYSTESQLS